MKGPLSEYRIVDLSRAIAGPYGTMLLADMGAEVIKIESPTGGDLSRLATGPDHKGELFYYMAFNRNKKDITLDLDTKTGKEALYDLVRISDVVWDNFRPGVMERLGADYETLKEINPKIISCSISGFGPTGPYADRPSYDITALALSGNISVTGEPGGRPTKPGPPIGDLAAGMFGALGVTSALAYRERTGQGQKIDTSLLEACISLLAYEISYYFCSGIIPERLGAGHLALLPYGVYKCQDDYIAIGPSWPRLAGVIGADWMIEDPRFKTGDERVKHREEFNQALEEHLAKASAADWLELFDIEDIAAAPVNDIAEAVTNVQVLHRNMILNLPHSLGGEVKLAGNPVKMRIIDESEYTAPPTRGEHNIAVLSGILGYSEEKIKELKEEEEGHRGEMILKMQKRRADQAARRLQERGKEGGRDE